MMKKLKIKLRPLTEPERKKITIIAIVMTLFFITHVFYTEGYFSKGKYLACEVGFVKKKNASGGGGPKIMVLKFNLKTKYPKGYVYLPDYGTGYSLSYGTYDVKKKDYRLEFKLSSYVRTTTLYFEGYRSRGQIIKNLTINRTNLNIENIKVIDGGSSNYSINKNRRIEYGSCKKESKPTNKI